MKFFGKLPQNIEVAQLKVFLVLDRCSLQYLDSILVCDRNFSHLHTEVREIEESQNNQAV